MRVAQIKPVRPPKMNSRVRTRLPKAFLIQTKGMARSRLGEWALLEARSSRPGGSFIDSAFSISSKIRSPPLITGLIILLVGWHSLAYERMDSLMLGTCGMRGARSRGTGYGHSQSGCLTLTRSLLLACLVRLSRAPKFGILYAYCAVALRYYLLCHGCHFRTWTRAQSGT